MQNKDLEEKNSKLQKEKSEIEKKYAKTDEAYKELLSKYVKMEDKVTLSCRISPQAKTTLNLVDSDKTILKYGNTSYHFGYIYPKETSQEAVFKSVQNLVQNTIDGKNVFIFAVGGSESGKTFTMYGEYGGTSKNEGLVPRTLDKIFETHGKMKKRGPKLEIKARYIHVCRGTGKGKEKYALVSPDKPKLRCKEENHSFENGLELSIKTYTIASKEDVSLNIPSFINTL
ncbi:Kinesin-like protein KIFC1 [Holothuria leucospilota]|uniref:Kinesin-like protein KIFC1 n=1 Tax=Holothuria leucospilota TaxID=206669 RepID=A0A9Q0Y980_HOLLE|nr:Kinesin-like protein KIFC1 [Holothuria leucospilota]